MGEHEYYLITILHGDQLLRCALKTEPEVNPMEHDTRVRLHAKLPLYVRSCGPIVEVQEIFSIHDSTLKRECDCNCG
jgi:hypothetical protein